MRVSNHTLDFGFVMVSTAISIGIVAGAWLLFFVNPIDWKDFKDFQSTDRVWCWVSNGFIMLLAIVLVAATWRALLKIKRKMANHAMH